MDYGHRNFSIPQPPPLPMHALGPQGSGSGLPISSDRLSSIGNHAKRSRIGVVPPHSRSPSDDPANSNGTSYYHPTHNTAASFSNTRQSVSGYHQSSQQHHHHSNASYPPFFSSSQASPPFGPGGPGLASRSGQGYGIPQHAGPSTSGTYESGSIYPSIIGRPGSSAISAQGSGSGGTLFSPFIDSDESNRHHPQQQPQSGFGGLEWPVHSSGNPGGPPLSEPGMLISVIMFSETPLSL